MLRVCTIFEDGEPIAASGYASKRAPGVWLWHANADDPRPGVR